MIKNHPIKLLIALAILVVGSVVTLFAAYATQSPAPLDSYAASVEDGRYLAKAGNCETCHTDAGGEPYAGGLAFKTEFGVLYSTNITADKETGIGDWSFEDFYQSMKHGVRPDGTHLYPAFPYTDFALMTDKDLASLYLYLQTIEPARNSNKTNALDFPYNLRPLLGFWKMLYHDSEAFVTDPEKSAEWNRGAYLVNGLGHCGACHTPRNSLGAERNELALTGGTYLDKVKFGWYRKWSAVNLTPAESGLASWSEEHLADYLKHGLSDTAVVHGPMTEVVMNSTSHLNDADIEAIATYLKNIPPNAQASGDAPDAEVLAAGEIGYTVHCGSCHLPTGLGDSVLGVPLAGNPIVQTPDPAALINVVLYGPHLPGPPFAVDRTKMKMFGKQLSDRDVASIASYIRNSFGNQASVVTPDQVKVQR